MLTRPIPFYYTLIALAAGVIIPLLLLQPKPQEKTGANEALNNCSNTFQRISGYRYVRPLLYAEHTDEAERFQTIKGNVAQKVEQMKAVGQLSSASVYVREFNQGDWMAFNESETFNPGSLIKVPVMMTILKMEEQNPGFLNKPLTYNAPTEEVPHQTFDSKSIETGKSYTVRELLKYMIAYSDNNATHLLNSQLDVALFKKTFTDVGLPEPDVADRNFQITAKNYSAFIKALFNASYISPEHSELAISLLSECNYKDGMLKGLPENTPIAHKFGEGGNKEIHQLHESGLIYMDDKPYLLIIMTKGADVQKLPEVISELTKVVVTGMKTVS